VREREGEREGERERERIFLSIHSLPGAFIMLSRQMTINFERSLGSYYTTS
jgi:hypothetical protein